jgi:hypothetical protein
MEKRIKFSKKTSKHGATLYVAKIQVRLLFGLWLTIFRVEDCDAWYAETHAQQVLAYLEGREHQIEETEV